MLKYTKCNIHTFDCTYKQGKSQDPRHTYHTWCLGDPKKGTDFRTWANVTSTLGHNRVHLLKMDIEGSEYDVLSTFRREDQLPDELSMELHVFSPSIAANVQRLSLIFHQLALLGYATYSQEVNKYAPACCCEYSFIRFPLH